MAGSVNKVILIGNLGRDPEIRSATSGERIANLSVATSETWKDKSGERQERTEWHRVTIFDDRLAEVAEKYLRKGSKIYVSGQLQTRKWTDQTGQERYSTEVVLSKFRGELTMLDSATDRSDRQAELPAAAPAARPYSSRREGVGNGYTPPTPAPRATRDELDDELPF